MEAAIGVICSSMPAMTAFGKLHIFQASFFASIRSRLLSYTSSKGNKDRTASSSAKSKTLKLPKSFADGFHSDSFMQLHNDDYVYLDDISYPRSKPRTDIAAGQPSRDLEVGLIEKSITVEQSSDKDEN